MTCDRRQKGTVTVPDRPGIRMALDSARIEHEPCLTFEVS